MLSPVFIIRVVGMEFNLEEFMVPNPVFYESVKLVISTLLKVGIFAFIR